jgi:hypothetical protein
LLRRADRFRLKLRQRPSIGIALKPDGLDEVRPSGTAAAILDARTAQGQGD